MSLQTGGLPIGAISTRSRSASWARRKASPVGTMPTVSPLGPTSRTSGTRIRSLMRNSVLMGPPGLRLMSRPEESFHPKGLRTTCGGPTITEGRQCTTAQHSDRTRRPRRSMRVGGASTCRMDSRVRYPSVADKVTRRSPRLHIGKPAGCSEPQGPMNPYQNLGSPTKPIRHRP